MVDPRAAEQITRIDTGRDGVMAPLVTAAEKVERRRAVRQKHRRRGKTGRPLAPRRKGSDRAFPEFKTITFYDEHGKHRHEVLSRKSRRQVGALLRHEARRPGFRYAREKIANVEGAHGIKTQLTERADQLPLDGLGLDLYRLGENFHRGRGRRWAAANAEAVAPLTTRHDSAQWPLYWNIPTTVKT